MAFLNYTKKEISAKIVYYGPGLSGKTTNLEWIHRKLHPDRRGKLISLETRTDRTLFFDFLPVQLGEIKGFQTRFNVYTVPGQIFYNETRKMVLKGVDGIVFVADSQREMANENVESLKNLEENLKSHGRKIHEIPLVFQYNKRDLSKIISVNEMNRLLNPNALPFFEAIAIHGDGVLATLTRITRMVAEKLQRSEENSLFASVPPPLAKQGPGKAEYLPLDVIEEEPQMPGKRIDSIGEPEGIDAPLSKMDTILHGDADLGTVLGEDIPSIGDISKSLDFPVEALQVPKKGVSPSPLEQQPKPQIHIETAIQPTSDSFGIEPSLRVIPYPQASAGPPGQEPDIDVGSPEKVGKHRVRVPISITLPGMNPPIILAVIIDLQTSPDKKKQ